MFRGTLQPLELVTVRPRVWVTRPGRYGLGGWQMETEVLEISTIEDDVIRHRYVQEPPPGSCFTVSDVRIS